MPGSGLGSSHASTLHPTGLRCECVALRFTLGCIIASMRISRILLTVILTAAIPIPAQNTPIKWMQFVSRGGWKIKYPAGWRLGSCASCKDVRASGVYVDFVPPQDLVGMVMVSPLADRPANTSVDAWFSQVASSANQNPIASQERFVFNGLPAVKVRYDHREDGTLKQMEDIYVVSGAHTFSISFGGEAPGRVEQQPNYAVYERMVETFTAGAAGSRGAR